MEYESRVILKNKTNTVGCKCQVLLNGNNTLQVQVAAGDTQVVL